MSLLEQTIAAIQDADAAAMAEARTYQERLTKPPGSLGVLEELAVRLAGITGQVDLPLPHKVIVVAAGDHGVVEEGVSAFPQEVTMQMMANFVQGGAAINVLARHIGARVVVADFGVCRDLEMEGIRDLKIRRGTANIARGPAMSREEAAAAVEAGIKLVQEEIEQGLSVLGTGDMGIGNTTPSAAILSAFSGLSPSVCIGRGTGVDDAGLRRKAKAVADAVVVNRPDPRDALAVLAAVGGLEIAGLAGCILGAAAARKPVVIDGFISGAAALTAARLQPRAAQYMIASHLSAEAGHRFMLDQLGLEPVLRMNLRLGEGTGAALAMGILDAAAKIVREMATFESAGVSGAL